MAKIAIQDVSARRRVRERAQRDGKRNRERDQRKREVTREREREGQPEAIATLRSKDILSNGNMIGSGATINLFTFNLMEKMLGPSQNIACAH